MRGKRSKQYRKLMQQYGLTFGFREPYQVLVDVGMLEASVQFKMDLVKSLSRTLHGEVKPMITQCTIRHLYNLPTSHSSQTQPQVASPTKLPGSQSSKSNRSNNSAPVETPVTLTSADKTAIITLAKTFEKRRCEHATDEPPLSTHSCLSSVIDPKDHQTNKHRYVFAVQDGSTREWARQIQGVPSVYVRRSVMIMEPMTEISANVRMGAEREKLRAGVKRKRGERDDNDVPKERNPAGTRNGDDDNEDQHNGSNTDGQAAPKKKKAKGPKQPNPLSARKPKKRPGEQASGREHKGDSVPRKRRRKHNEGDHATEQNTPAAANDD